MSILKRGIVTMPLPTHRTFTRYLLQSNWHRPFELLPYPSQSYMDLLSWILKGSMLTSSLQYKTTQYLWNTLMPELTQDGPLVPMGCSDIPDAYMSQIPAYAFVFFSNHTITHLQDIMVSPRPFTRFTSITTGLDSQPMSKTTANHAPPVPVPNLCTTDHTGFSSSFPFPRDHGIPSPWIS